MIGKLGEKLGATLLTWWKAALKVTTDSIFKPIEDFIDSLATKLYKSMETGSTPGENILAKWGLPKTITSDWWEETKHMSPIARVFSTTIMSIMSTVMYFVAVISPASTRATYQVMSMVTPLKAGLDDAITAYFRENISHSVLREYAAINGFDPTELAILQSTRANVLGVDAIREAFLRGDISDAATNQRLKWLGYPDTESEIIKKLFFPIPPAQDLIRMAVREVFSPEIAGKYGLFEDFPAEFANYAKMQGLTNDWAKNYWAAHWELPSAQMGFAMLHRGIIDEGELDVLLRALDYMPYWRDKVKDISYSPYTRVDVRRMYSAGVLDEAGVRKAYAELGYNPEKANNLTEFTIAEYGAEERDLTKAEVLDAFKRQAIDEVQAREWLKSLDYSDTQADIFISKISFERLETKRKKLVSTTKSLFKKKVIDEAEVTIRLNAENIPTPEIEELLDIWRIEEKERVNLPSVATLKAWAKKAIISPEFYREELVRLNTPEKYIDFYLMEIESPEEE